MRLIPPPVLDVVPLEICMLHESVEPQRVEMIASRLLDEEVLRNPPIVASVDGGLLVLDGATRISAFRRSAAFRSTVAQIVDYADPAIELATWAHLLPDLTTADLRQRLEQIPGVGIRPVDRDAAHDALHRRELLCYVLDPAGETWAVEGGRALGDEARLLDSIFATYAHRSPVQRVALDQDTFWDSEIIGVGVIFPRYTKSELIALVADGGVLPGGITRHIIPGRALRINVPLKLLREGDLESQRSGLRDWLGRQHEAGRVRLYPEPTWIFDE